MDNRRRQNGDRCAACGWPSRDPYTVVSRHPVAEGVVVYTRCACGTLRVWLHRSAAPARLVAGRPSAQPGATRGTPGPGTTEPEPQAAGPGSKADASQPQAAGPEPQADAPEPQAAGEGPHAPRR